MECLLGRMGKRLSWQRSSGWKQCGTLRKLQSWGGLGFKAALPNLFGTRDRFCGRQFFHGQGGRGMVQAVMRVMGSDGERGVADEASLALPPLTSCCAVPVCDPGDWGPLV